MNKNERNVKWLLVGGMVFLAAMSRLLPHPPNFTPIGGMALFGAAYFSRKYLAFLVPFLAFWVSDLVLNNVVYAAYFEGFVWFSQPFLWSAAAMLLIVGVGSVLLKKVNPKLLMGCSLLASVLFFLISNFGVWASGTMYPMTTEGLMAAYVAGIPYFGYTIAGDLAYTAVLFGGFELLKRELPSLKMA